MVVYLVLRMRELAQGSAWAVLNACRWDISAAAARNREVGKLAFEIKKRTSDFVIGMREPTLINPPARLIAYCRAGFGCEHVLINLN